MEVSIFSDPNFPFRTGSPDFSPGGEPGSGGDGGGDGEEGGHTPVQEKR